MPRKTSISYSATALRMNSIDKQTMLAALAATVLAITTPSAHAADEFHTFKSVLSSANADWCIEAPGADYKSGEHLAISACSGRPNQTFGSEDGGTLTVGGYCLDGLAGTPNQPPAAGDPVVINECDGSDHQVWELPPFKNRPGVFAIANQDGLCVTVDGASIGEGTPLVLAQCAELDTQGWLSGTAAAAPAPGGASEYYWYSGHRYCWYDAGWHGGGWYWCGENFHEGIGWGGPLGWHWWHHRGWHWWHHHHQHFHPPHVHPPHLHPPHGTIPHRHLQQIPGDHRGPRERLVHPHTVRHLHYQRHRHMVRHRRERRRR